MLCYATPSNTGLIFGKYHSITRYYSVGKSWPVSEFVQIILQYYYLFGILHSTTYNNYFIVYGDCTTIENLVLEGGLIYAAGNAFSVGGQNQTRAILVYRAVN